MVVILVDMTTISLPEVYTNSQDFRFFCQWFTESLQKIQYDTENISDLYDPMRCPSDLLWALADTMGYTYDDRLNLPVSFNRLVLLNFMKQIYLRGSELGVTLSAEVNLAQFNLMDYAKENDILYDRLEDTSIPANAVNVTAHTEAGYIDVVYYSSQLPTDACIEYTRPLGMFLFQHAGVKFSSRTKISIDARLTDSRDLGYSPTPYDDGPMPQSHLRNGWITQVDQYSREDYGRMQIAEYTEVDGRSLVFSNDPRQDAWYRNSKYEAIQAQNPDSGLNEDGTNPNISPGVRSLYSLQLSNNDHVVKSLIPEIFSLGYDPQEVGVEFPDDYLINPSEQDKAKPWNLRYDLDTDKANTPQTDEGYFISTVDEADPRTTSEIHPYPAVNPVMGKVGDAMSASDDNSSYYDPTFDDESE